jgi:hypothetical protein
MELMWKELFKYLKDACKLFNWQMTYKKFIETRWNINKNLPKEKHKDLKQTLKLQWIRIQLETKLSWIETKVENNYWINY